MSNGAGPVCGRPYTQLMVDEKPTVEPAHPSLGERAGAVARKVVAAVLIVAVLVGAYFLLAAFLPRWWAQQVGHRVGGSFSGGIGMGLTVGFICTFVPILLIVFAVISRGRLRNVPAIACALLAVVVAVPNLLTLAVVLGGNNSAHAGERIFDVDAPGFRGASAWGAIVGALIAILVAYVIWGYRRRGRKLHESQAREAEARALLEHPDEPPH